MRTVVCTAVRAGGARAVKGVWSMSETYIACCGGWLIFLVALITITEILRPSISKYQREGGRAASPDKRAKEGESTC